MEPRPLALDHNFPRPILTAIQASIPEVKFEPVALIQAWLADLEDHDLIYELARRGYDVMATANYKMLNDLQVLVAIRQTRMSVFAIEGVGDDAVVAAGALLRDVLPALKKLSPRGQVFRFKPTTPRAEPAIDAFAKLAARVDGRPADEVFEELQISGWRTDKAPHPDA